MPGEISCGPRQRQLTWCVQQELERMPSLMDSLATLDDQPRSLYTAGASSKCSCRPEVAGRHQHAQQSPAHDPC